MPRPRSWTDDDLREAVATSTTYKEVRDRLGLRGGSSHVAIRVRIAELGIDDAHLREAERRRRRDRERARRSAPPPDLRTWTDADLIEAVARARSLNAVFGHLGLRVGGSQWVSMQRHIERLGLATDHWDHELPARRAGRPRRWSDDQLRRAVVGARSFADVVRALGLAGGGSHATVRRRIEELGLDTSGFVGRGWARGRDNPGGRQRRPLTEILVAGSDYLDSHRLRKRLIEEQVLPARCDTCGLEDWQGRPAPLQLDHVNGDRRDNRLENLRILCANCHAQTPTYGARNRGRYAPRTDGS